jgi:hypothetical protein
VAAGVAVSAEEPVGRDTALEIGADFPLHETGDRRAFRARAREEGGALLADDPV